MYFMGIDHHNHSEWKLIWKRNTCKVVSCLFLDGEKSQEFLETKEKKIWKIVLEPDKMKLNSLMKKATINKQTNK